MQKNDEKILPQVSILVNNFKGTKELKFCLESLLKTNYPNFEILVMDCCTTNFEEWMKKFPTVKFVHLDYDVGTAEQKNISFKNCNPKSKYVCFIDDDVYVTQDWLKPLVKEIEIDSTIGMIQPVLLGYIDKDKIDSLGHKMTRTGYIYKIPQTKQNLSILKEIRCMDIFYAETALVLAQRDLLTKLSVTKEPFDGNYFIGWDDIDLSWRVWLSGHRVVITFNSTCYHDRGHSNVLGDEKNSIVYNNARNRLITILKNYELKNIIKYFPITLLLECVKLLLVLRRKPIHSIITLKAILWVLFHLNYVRKQRKKFSFLKRIQNDELDKVFVKTNFQYLRSELQRHYS